VTACSGKCGRPGVGWFDSGQPDLDKRFTWCDECWGDLYNKRMPPTLRADVPPGTYMPFRPEPLTVPQYNSVAATEHKIVTGQRKTVMADAPPAVDTGWFEGIANVTGVRDRQGDVTVPGCFLRTAGDLNAGRVAWALTRTHSDDPVDVVGWIDQARETPEGLWVRGRWAPDAVAQDLRGKVAAGAKLSLSITYLAPGAQPDGMGGRILPEVDVTSVAVTNGPASAGSFIRAGKGAPPLTGARPVPETAPIVDLYADVQQQAEHNHPDRERKAAEDRLLSAASWPPRHFDRETRLALINGAARAKALRLASEDDDGERAGRERWERDNEYSSNLHAWMAAHQ
jgi:HK97 family phage prohead protease